MLSQERHAIGDTDTFASLSARLAAAGAAQVVRMLRHVAGTDSSSSDSARVLNMLADSRAAAERLASAPMPLPKAASLPVQPNVPTPLSSPLPPKAPKLSAALERLDCSRDTAERAFRVWCALHGTHFCAAGAPPVSLLVHVLHCLIVFNFFSFSSFSVPLLC